MLFRHGHNVQTECLKELGLSFNQPWPKVDKKLLEENEVIFVIQINGKKKDTIKVKKNIDEKNLLSLIQSNQQTKKILENKKINKYFFVKNRLINILLK